MERRRTLVRRAGLAAVALLAVSGLAACSGTGLVGRAPAATVGGTHITRREVDDLLKSQERQLKKETSGANGAQAQVALDQLHTTRAGTYTVASSSFVLTQLVLLRAYERWLTRHHHPITTADRKAARTDLETRSGGAAALAKIDPGLVSFSVEIGAAGQEFQKIARPDLERKLYPKVRATSPLCLGLIFTATKAKAAAARALVDQGQDFAAVARTHSEDAKTAQAGGFAGCATPAAAKTSFTADFSHAKVGDLFGPIAINGQGFVVLKVVSTTGPTYAQAKAQIDQQISPQQSAQQSVSPLEQAASVLEQQAISEVRISIDPRYGHWDARTASVVPPADAAPPTTTTSTTVVPTTSIGHT